MVLDHLEFMTIISGLEMAMFLVGVDKVRIIFASTRMTG